MARNKFDVDEKLESPFQWKHLKRAGHYVSRHKYKMLLALLLSAMATVASLYIPKITQWVLDEAVPMPPRSWDSFHRRTSQPSIRISPSVTS